MSNSGLSALQRRLLAEIAQRSSAFFMTGGGVLVEWAEALSAQVESIITTPDFKRYLVRAEDGATRVDFVHDRAPQLFPKLRRDGIVTDSDEEIFVNKICSLVERSEPRDLLDLMLLEGRGMRVEDYLPQAQKKDGGASAATLAWLLSQFKISDHALGGVHAEQLRKFAKELEQRMLVLARP